MDDVELLLKARRGDEAAFSELFSRHRRALYLYATRMAGQAFGDDVVQETFLAVLRRGGGYDPARGTVAAYLFGIARHFVLKQLGSRYDASFADDHDNGNGDAQPETPLEALTRTALVDAVRAAVDALPPVFREVVVLCELQEMDYATAAEIIQCPIGTVRSRLHRARTLLMAALATERPVARIRGG